MTVTKLNGLHTADEEPLSESPPPRSELGWEGHVHFSEDLPLWKRVLDTWPELRTGLSYSLIFASGVVLGSAIMAAVAGSKAAKKSSSLETREEPNHG